METTKREAYQRPDLPAEKREEARQTNQRRYVYGGRAEGVPGPKCAWVVLLMIGDAYAPGAVVVAQSLRDVRTRHALVCMVTSDVSDKTRALLRRVYDQVVEVPYITHKARALASKKQAELYNSWIDRSFTKWNCLKLTEWDRVMFVDADIVFLTNCDDLFELRPPAANFTNAWAYPWQRRGGVPNPYLECAKGQEARCDLPHGAVIPAPKILAALRETTFVGNGFLVLLAPDAAVFEAFLALVNAADVFGADQRTISGADEASICQLYAGRGVSWTNIHQRYAAIPWKKEWVSRDIRAYHYLGRKPWDMDAEEWPDLADWWRVAERLAARDPDMKALLYPAADTAAVAPLDADSAQLRLTNDLRALLTSAAKTRRSARTPKTSEAIWETADVLLERWLTAMAYSGDGERVAWAKAYRRSSLSDDFNNELAGGLVDSGLARSDDDAGRLVVEMLALVDKRLGRPPRPSGAKPVCVEGRLSFGSHFQVPAGARALALIERGRCDAAVATALRHSILVPSGLSLPQAHLDAVYLALGVRNEAFASPMHSRLYGKPDVAFCSPFPDTDTPFGCLGVFFATPLDKTPGAWLVVPPVGVPELADRAVEHVLTALGEGAATALCLIPWGRREACERLRKSPALVADVQLEPGAFAWERPSGQKVPSTEPFLYVLLSSETSGPALKDEFLAAVELMREQPRRRV